MEGWLKVIQFITGQFGLPGSLAVAIASYLIYLLREERASHALTRDKIDQINEKRIETSGQMLIAIRELKDALEAVTAILGKNK
jgi:hypothetical protein